MLILAGTSDKIRVQTSGAELIDVHASFTTYDGTAVTTGRVNVAISSAGLTDIVPSPVVATQRNVKTLSIRNKDVTPSTVTVIHTDGTTPVILERVTLLPGEALTLVQGEGFRRFRATGSHYQRDMFAANRIVDRTGSGTDLTIEDALVAIAALPNGGTIFLKDSTYDLSVGLSIPANTRIIGMGRNATTINMIGAFTLFTTTGGYFCLAELTVQGDDTSAQIVLNTDHDVDVQCADFVDIYGIINAVSSAVEVSMRDCYILLAASAGTGIFLWKGAATGGKLNWDYVHMSVPITDATLVEGPTPVSAGCNWKVVQSYTGAPPPVAANYYYTSSVDWMNFKIDVAKIRVLGTTNKVVGCDFNTCSVRFEQDSLPSKTLVTGCHFEIGATDVSGDWTSQLSIGYQTSEAVISGCEFRGGAVSLRGVYVEDGEKIVICGCLFLGHTQSGVHLNFPDSTVTVTGCDFTGEINAAVIEGGDCVGTYSGNTGFGTSGLSSNRSIVDSDNFRNVRTWGAKGDGNTDDGIAIYRALLNLPASGGTLFFPPGTYKITSPILLPNKPVTIKGSGDSSVINVASASFAAFRISGLSVVTNYSITDLKVVGGGGGVAVPVGGAVVGASLTDAFASAPSITGANGTFSAGDTTGFTHEAGEPPPQFGTGLHSGWLEWTAPASGTAIIDLSGSTFDTVLCVYTGATIGSLVPVVADDDSGAGASSLVTFLAVMGTSYKIRVDGYGTQSGPVTFTMSLFAGAASQTNSIVQLHDANSRGVVSLERVNAYEVAQPIKVTAGVSSTPIIVNVTDCYFQQIANGSSILIVNSPSGYRPVNLTLDKVRFYRDFEDAVVGTLAEGGFFINYSNVNFIATDCFFASGTDDCVIGALNARGCTFYNGAPASNKRICVADDNFSAISSSVEGCLFSYVDMDIVGNGTKFSDCTFQTSMVRDDAISYFSDCYFLGVTGPSNTPNNAVIFGSGDTAVVGCYFDGSNTFGAIILDPGRVIGCKFTGAAATGYITLENGSALISGNDFPNGSPAIIETVSGANVIFGNRFRRQPTLLATSQALANKVSDVSTQGTIFTQTADVTIANTVAETSLLGTGKGVKTIPADWMVVGRTLRLILRGYMSDTGTPTFRVKVKLGATVILDTGAVAFSGTIANNEWCVAADITCRVAGFSGTVIGQGSFSESPDNRVGMVNTAPVAVNLFTSPLALDVTFEWGTASASNTITCTNATLEAV